MVNKSKYIKDAIAIAPKSYSQKQKLAWAKNGLAAKLRSEKDKKRMRKMVRGV